MAQALIGHTGFVGGTLLAQTTFDATYNSTNIEQIKGQEFDLIVCAGAPGRKWEANQRPAQDRASLDRLTQALNSVRAKEFILISTVDVYPRPIDVDEATLIDNGQNSPYGHHRRLLEQYADDRFPTLIVRLPGLFGRGLKKNVIFDFLHHNRTDRISPDSTFQFYDLKNLWLDIGQCREHSLGLVNLATEPVSVRTVAREGFEMDFDNPAAPPPVRYDMHTKFAGVLGGGGDYLYSRNQVLESLRRFVLEERAA